MALDTLHEPGFHEDIPEFGCRPVPGADSFGIDRRSKMYQPKDFAEHSDGALRFESDRYREGFRVECNDDLAGPPPPAPLQPARKIQILFNGNPPGRCGTGQSRENDDRPEPVWDRNLPSPIVATFEIVRNGP